MFDWKSTGHNGMPRVSNLLLIAVEAKISIHLLLNTHKRLPAKFIQPLTVNSTVTYSIIGHSLSIFSNYSNLYRNAKKTKGFHSNRICKDTVMYNVRLDSIKGKWPYHCQIPTSLFPRHTFYALLCYCTTELLTSRGRPSSVDRRPCVVRPPLSVVDK